MPRFSSVMAALPRGLRPVSQSNGALGIACEEGTLGGRLWAGVTGRIDRPPGTGARS